MNSIEKGYKFFEENASAFEGSYNGNEYISSINTEIIKFQSIINNEFIGSQTSPSSLQGTFAEFWHSGTHNIDATIKEKSIRTSVLQSNEFASADVVDNTGIEYGMKYYQSGTGSAKSQAQSVFERYSLYKAKAIKNDQPVDSLEIFMNKRGYNDVQLLHDPIYAGQVRVIPKDQMYEAINWLEKKIVKESINRPDQVQRYEDTLKMLKDKIETSQGTESIPLSRDESQSLALAAQKGEFDASDHGVTTTELINYKYIMEQAFKAGLTAATISMVLKAAPDIYKAIDYLIKTGELDEQQFKKIGFAALKGSAEGFLRGTIAAALTIHCKAELWGEALKSISPAVIGAVTVLVVDVMKNSFLIAQGKMTKGELLDNLVRGLYVSTGALIGGGISQSLINIPVLGFMLGSFVGSVIGSFTYSASTKTYLSFCIDSGFTMFGLVKQDYKLPQELLEEIGLSTLEYERMQPESYEYNTFEADTFEANLSTYETLGITMVKRGVIGVNRIGYV